MNIPSSPSSAARAAVSATWQRTHCTALTTIDPAANLDDLHHQGTLTDLRQAPTDPDGSELLAEIRARSTTTHASLGQAFDAIIPTPLATRDRTVTC